MFDDQPNTQSGGVPGNLPVAPDDIFADTEKLPSEPPPSIPNALNSGMLKPKSAAPAVTDKMGMAAPSVSTLESLSPERGPVLGKIIFAVLVLAILGGLGFGAWWVYQKVIGVADQQPPINTVQTPITSSPTTTSVTPVNLNQTTGATTSATSSAATNIKNDTILFGETIDTDKDGLDDVREKQIGTNQNDPDTDDDGLSDGDEVIIWKTDPLNPDTDKDGYPDGTEVRNGYNPLGPGKLFTTPTSTTSTKK